MAVNAVESAVESAAAEVVTAARAVAVVSAEHAKAAKIKRVATPAVRAPRVRQLSKALLLPNAKPARRATTEIGRGHV